MHDLVRICLTLHLIECIKQIDSKLHDVHGQALNNDIFDYTDHQIDDAKLKEMSLALNANSSVRKKLDTHFRKRILFDKISEDDLQKVEDKLNNRPRKCLAYKTPFELFNKSCERWGIALHI